MKIEQLFCILSDEEKKQMLAIARNWESQQVKQDAKSYRIPLSILRQMKFDDFDYCVNKIEIIKLVRKHFKGIGLCLAKIIVEQACELHIKVMADIKANS